MKYRVLASIAVTIIIIVAYLMFGARPGADMEQDQEPTIEIVE